MREKRKKANSIDPKSHDVQKKKGSKKHYDRLVPIFLGREEEREPPPCGKKKRGAPF